MLRPDELNQIQPDIRKLILDRTAYSKKDSDGFLFYSPNCDAILQAWMNHSDTPNTTGTETLRPIKKGEELTEDYRTLAEGAIHPVSLKHFGFLDKTSQGGTRRSKRKGGTTKKKHIHSYYNSRKDFHYYKKVKDILDSLHFSSIIDIGCRKSPMMKGLRDNVYKAMLDIQEIPPIDGIHMIQADFYTWEPDRTYDVVLCLQVLEHLDKPKEFAQKLLQVGKTVIISVPYKWKKGACKYHTQDPVDKSKVLGWVGREPDEEYIIKDKTRERLICVYKA